MTEVRVSDEDVCDFCSHPKPERVFNVADFPMDHAHDGLPEYRSKGGWMACSVCAAYIDVGNWDALLWRAVDRMALKWGSQIPKRILVDQVRRSHDLFRQHYKGEKS